MIARDERYANRALSDGSSRLGAAILRAGLEVLQQELDRDSLPTVWALIRRDNEVSKRVFGEFAFYPHDRSPENQQDVFVRRAGRPLPPAPSAEAYIPLAVPATARGARSGERSA
jgi:hypothetical protein